MCVLLFSQFDPLAIQIYKNGNETLPSRFLYARPTLQGSSALKKVILVIPNGSRNKSD